MWDARLSPGFRIKSYLAPDTIPTDVLCRVLRIPNDRRIIAAVSDVLAYLTGEDVFETDSEAEEIQIRAAMSEMVYQYFTESECPVSYVGEIKPFLTNALPDGILLCDGSQYNEVDYPALYAALPAAFKSAGVFTVPNLTGRTLVGIGSGYVMASQGGAATHVLTPAEMPIHSHAVNAHNHAIPAHGHTTQPHNHTQASHEHELQFRINSTGFGTGTPTQGNNTGSTNARTTSAIAPIINAETVIVNDAPATVTSSVGPGTSSAGQGNGHNNMPPYLVVRYGIVAR